MHPRPSIRDTPNSERETSAEGVAFTIADVASRRLVCDWKWRQIPLPTKLQEVRRAIGEGADEIDMVIDRCAFLTGDHAKVFDEIAATKEAGGAARLKVILETGELVIFDNVRLASEIAMQAGGDFIKISTGKVNPAVTMPVTLVRLEAIRDYFFCHRPSHRHEAGRRHPHIEAGARLSGDGQGNAVGTTGSRPTDSALARARS